MYKSFEYIKIMHLNYACFKKKVFTWQKKMHLQGHMKQKESELFSKKNFNLHAFHQQISSAYTDRAGRCILRTQIITDQSRRGNNQTCSVNILIIPFS